MTWITTHSGKVFDFLKPHEHEFDIYDIAHALANINRFCGHTREPYSVAQHSVLMSNIVTPRLGKAALLHDGAEAYLGDVSSPLKALLPEYKVIEARTEFALMAHFGIEPVTYNDPEIKRYDMRFLASEKRDLLAARDMPWPTLEGVTPVPYKIKPRPWILARDMFLARYFEIVNVEKGLTLQPYLSNLTSA